MCLFRDPLFAYGPYEVRKLWLARVSDGSSHRYSTLFFAHLFRIDFPVLGYFLSDNTFSCGYSKDWGSPEWLVAYDSS
jgi:hypothetical protein